MAARTWMLALLVATSAILAGCTNNDNGNDGNDDTNAGAPPVSEPAPGSGGSTPPPRETASPENFALQDAGEIEGSFSEAWDIEVANIAFRDAGLHFALQGLQPGTPPTALIHLTLYDPNGAAVQTGSVGLGAPSNELTWTFSPGQLPLAGTYQLKAENAPQGTLPSAGFAAWTLEAHVTY